MGGRGVYVRGRRNRKNIVEFKVRIIFVDIFREEELNKIVKYSNKD